MNNPVLPTDPVERTEELADKIGFKSKWDGPAFVGSAYEHVLPLFEATYEWITYANFGTHAQQSRKRDLERAAVEIWPPSNHGRFGENARYDPTIVRAEVFIGHLAFIQTFPNYFEVGISEWPIDRLLMEFENAHINRNNYAMILTLLGVAGTANYGINSAATAVSKRYGSYAVTAVLKGTGLAGGAITIASALISYTAFLAEKRKIRNIDIHVTQERVPHEISEESWETFERRVEDEYGSDPEPEELK